MLDAVELGEAREWLGDPAALARQVGSAEGLSSLASASASSPGAVNSFKGLRDFLERYQRRVLVPLELPAVYQAHRHASRFEVRELIALDQRLGAEPEWQPFAAASRRVGCLHLAHLRPLRDQRLVQRYARAIGRGEAVGWHTLVYGLTLAVYSLPVRQGLVHYGREALGGFIHAAACSLALTEADVQQLRGALHAGLPRAVEALLKVCAPEAPALA